MSANSFTPTQQRIMGLLKDGQPHEKPELLACLDDEMATWQNVCNHISAIRKSIVPEGLQIVPILRNRRICYQLVRLFTPGSPMQGGVI